MGKTLSVRLALGIPLPAYRKRKSDKGSFCYHRRLKQLPMEGKSEHEELVEDILTIIVSFSSRIYGARGGRKRKEKSDAESTQD